MKARRALASTPMRLAMGLVALFGTVSLVSLGAAYWVTAAGLDASMRSDLAQTIAGYKATEDQSSLIALVEAQAKATDPARRLFAFTDTSGRMTGNYTGAVNWQGWQILTLDAAATEGDGTFLALATDLFGGRMMVAQSRSQISDLTEVFQTVFLFSLLPTFAVALGGAYALGRRSAKRVEDLSLTLDRLTGGNLAARVGKTNGPDDDLTDIGLAINRMAAAQEASVSALRQVSADIAHDLKTPIQRVAVLIERAGATDTLAPGVAALLDEAHKETIGIVATFQSLLTIAQIEGGSPKSRFVLVDLCDIARTFAELYAPAAEDSGHSLSVDTPDKRSMIVAGDRGLLGRLIANLIENALRHTPAGTKISVKVSQMGEKTCLEVSDNGPGIPAAERTAVLRRLYRLEQSRSKSGNGLGLSLVEAVADLHDGQLLLEDNRPGLLVRLILPRVLAP